MHKHYDIRHEQLVCLFLYARIVTLNPDNSPNQLIAPFYFWIGDGFFLCHRFLYLQPVLLEDVTDMIDETTQID